jgi:hypothetical protein
LPGSSILLLVAERAASTKDKEKDMNKLTRGIAIAGVAGAALLGSITLSTATSGAQEDPSASAPAATNGTTAPGQDAPSPQGCDHGPGRHHGPNLDVAASAIGIDVDALRDALRDGSTLAQVAEAHGVDPQTVIDALVADVQSHLAEQVASGELTQAEADQRLADATERITDHVQNGRPERPDAPADRPAPPAPESADS